MKQFRIDGFSNYATNVRKQVFRVNNDGSTRPLSLRSDGRYKLVDDFGNDQYRTPDSLYWSTMEAVRHSIPSIRDVGYPFSRYMVDNNFNAYSKKSGKIHFMFSEMKLSLDDNTFEFKSELFLFAWSIDVKYERKDIRNLHVITSERMEDRIRTRQMYPNKYRFDIGLKDMRLIDSHNRFTLLEQYIGYATMVYGNSNIVVDLNKKTVVETKEGVYSSVFSIRKEFNTKTRGIHFLLPVKTTSFGTEMLYVPETALDMDGFLIGQNIRNGKTEDLLS